MKDFSLPTFSVSVPCFDTVETLLLLQIYYYSQYTQIEIRNMKIFGVNSLSRSQIGENMVIIIKNIELSHTYLSNEFKIEKQIFVIFYTKIGQKYLKNPIKNKYFLFN